MVVGAVAIGMWEPCAPPVPAAAVIVAPHPDDEILGLGATLRWLQQVGAATTLITCTDGEASHPRSRRITPELLRTRRRHEQARALKILGVSPTHVRLGLPDGGLSDVIDQLAEHVDGLTPADAAVIVPWRHDGHPDHHAASVAGLHSVQRTGAALWQVLIWGKVRRARSLPRRTSHLRLNDATVERKARAVAEFATQVRAVGPDPVDGPVVTHDELALMLDGSETVMW